MAKGYKIVPDDDDEKEEGLNGLQKFGIVFVIILTIVGCASNC